MFRGALQVLMRYTTNKTDDAIKDYNSFSNIARDEDVSYAMYGELNSENAGIFKFPFLRDIEALPIIEQCHSMLRTRFWTQEFAADINRSDTGPPLGAQNDDYNAAPATDTATSRKLITLEAIMGYLKQGVEWKPLSVDKNHSGSSHVSRQEIVRVLKDYSAGMPLNLLYDSRFVSEDSHFCASAQAEPISTTQKIEKTTQSSKDRVIFEMDANLPSLGAYGMSGRTIGNIEHLCPCETQNAIDVLHAQCKISSSICSIRHSQAMRDSADAEQFAAFFPLCASYVADSNTLATMQLYKMRNITYVRNLLREHGKLLKQSGFACKTYHPSDLWGIKPSHFTNQQYLNTSYNDPIRLSYLHAMMHPKSGVSALNYQSVTEQINSVLGEDDREVSLVCLREYAT